MNDFLRFMLFVVLAFVALIVYIAWPTTTNVEAHNVGLILGELIHVATWYVLPFNLAPRAYEFFKNEYEIGKNA